MDLDELQDSLIEDVDRLRVEDDVRVRLTLIELISKKSTDLKREMKREIRFKNAK